MELIQVLLLITSIFGNHKYWWYLQVFLLLTQVYSCGTNKYTYFSFQSFPRHKTFTFHNENYTHYMIACFKLIIHDLINAKNKNIINIKNSNLNHHTIYQHFNVNELS